MNRDRRKRLGEIAARIEDMKSKLDELKQIKDDIASDLEDLRDEEQEAFDNLAESFQQGEKGQAMEQAIEHLSNAHSAIEDIDLDGGLDDAISSIEDAKE